MKSLNMKQNSAFICRVSRSGHVIIRVCSWNRQKTHTHIHKLLKQIKSSEIVLVFLQFHHDVMNISELCTCIRWQQFVKTVIVLHRVSASHNSEDPVTKLGNDERISRFNCSSDRFHPAEKDCTKANAFSATPIREVWYQSLLQVAACKEHKEVHPLYSAWMTQK